MIRRPPRSTLSLHDALPISYVQRPGRVGGDELHVHGPTLPRVAAAIVVARRQYRDRKSTRLNSSHGYISYAVFCLKKKKKALDRHTASSPPQSDLRAPSLSR